MYKYIYGIIAFLLIMFAHGADESGPAVSIPYNDINNFAKVYALLKNYYVESVPDTKLISGAISGMLNNLDPHSDYLESDEFQQMVDMTSGSFAGIGIEITKEKNTGIKVIAPVYGTPAYFVGLQSGDIIVKINDTVVADMPLDQAVKLMRGKENTNVKLTIVRKNKPLTFLITRKIIKINSVKYTMLDKYYGYILISNFQGNTNDELLTALKKIYTPSLQGIILDLRNNPGGLLDSAVDVSSVFLPAQSLVVYTDGRAKDSKNKFYVESNIESKIHPEYKKIKLIVLVNQGTASAAEIVAGALQDNKRAQIVGTKTFGKGSVQTVIQISKTSAIKFTTALYYTPSGKSIQAEGIAPNVTVLSEYNDIINEVTVSESELGKHITNPNAPESYESVTIIKPPKQLTEKDLTARIEKRLASLPKISDQSIQIDINDDFQLQYALFLLKKQFILRPSLRL